MNETVEEGEKEKKGKKVTRIEVNREYTKGNLEDSKCEAHCSRRMCWSRRYWREQVKQKEKGKKKEKNKVTKEIISHHSQHCRRQMPSSLYMSFFFSSWTLLRPCAFTKRTVRGNPACVYVSPCDMSKR